MPLLAVYMRKLMKIVVDYPPNYETICKHFKIKNMLGIVFTYGDTLYSPHSKDIDAHLMTHEMVHEKQQAAIGVEAWWAKYYENSEFRLQQELEAYRQQYQFIREHHNREFRKRVLKQISADLAGPIYGNILTKEKAAELIKGE